jgi:hypothetical protein
MEVPKMLNLQRRKLYDTAQVNFSRASAAYNQSGLKIPNNIPRYEWGRWQNLLTKNQSDAEVDTAGWVNALSNISYNVTSIARDTTEKSEGSASIKAVTSGTRTEGAGVITANVVPGKTYISSMKVKGPAGANMKFDAAYSYATGSKTGTAVEFVATGGWQRIFHIITIDPAHI